MVKSLGKNEHLVSLILLWLQLNRCITKKLEHKWKLYLPQIKVSLMLNHLNARLLHLVQEEKNKSQIILPRQQIVVLETWQKETMIDERVPDLKHSVKLDISTLVSSNHYCLKSPFM